MNHHHSSTPLQPVGYALRRTVSTAGVLLSALALLAGCESMSARERGTAQGAGIGAVAGALIGAATGNSGGQGAVLGGAVGAVAGNLWSKHMEDKRQALAASAAGTAIAVDRTADDRLKLNVPTDASFETGRADIQSQLRPVLDELGRNLGAGVRIDVIGHTDSSGGDAMNDALSLQRAEAVRNYLTRRGVSWRQVSVSGRGEREPVATNATDAGRAKNRRVEIFLTEPQT